MDRQEENLLAAEGVYRQFISNYIFQHRPEAPIWAALDASRAHALSLGKDAKDGQYDIIYLTGQGNRGCRRCVRLPSSFIIDYRVYNENDCDPPCTPYPYIHSCGYESEYLWGPYFRHLSHPFRIYLAARENENLHSRRG